MRVVQDHPPQAPVVGIAVPARRCSSSTSKSDGCGLAEEGGDLRAGGGALVDAAGVAGGRRAGDAPAPGIGRLAGRRGVVRVRVRQVVVGRHVHQDERIEGDAVAAGLQLLDRLHDGAVGRRAAVGRAVLRVAADEMRRAAADAVDRPVLRRRRLGADLDARADAAVPGAQVVAEPGDHERDRLHLRRAGLQPVERDHDVGGMRLGVDVLRRRGLADLAAHDLGRVGELARGRDQRDGADQALGGLAVEDRAEHLEGELRQPVAEALERQLLEDDIGRAAIGRRVRRAHLRRDERIGVLVLAAEMDAHGHAVEAHRLAVGPDAPDAGDRALAERDREARRSRSTR